MVNDRNLVLLNVNQIHNLKLLKLKKNNITY